MIKWLKRILTGKHTDAHGNQFFTKKIDEKPCECIKPAHPDDKALLRIAQKAKVGGTILPSGFRIPAGQWRVVGELIICEG